MEAAHSAGVVHRDLKPANIMLEGDQRADHGLRHRALGQRGTMMTMAGGVIGTLDYMAPEQAAGSTVDHRADISTMGLILHDLLVGRTSRPRTDNPVGDLMARLQTPPTVRAVDPSIPEALDQIIARCLEKAPDARFQTTHELSAAIAALDGTGACSRVTHGCASDRAASGLAAAAILVGCGGMVLIIAVSGGVWWVTRGLPSGSEQAAVAPLSVLVANFENRTGDAVFDGVLEQALTLGIEGAAFITTYPRQSATRIAAEIAPRESLDEERARLVSVREGVRIVLVGTIDRTSDGYRIAARGVDAASGKTVAQAEATANDKGTLLAAAANVATQLRRDLGDVSAKSGAPESETFTAASLEAASAYTRAQDLAAAGRFPDAITLYQEALQRDPNFGRAYAGWATASYRIGRPDEAENLWKKALTLIERMTEREKYRTLGTYYMASGNNEQAIQNYQMLLDRYPADGTAINNLAVAYFNSLDFRRAIEHGRKVLDIYPTNLNYRTNLALYSMYASDFSTAVAESEHVLKLGSFDKAYLPLATAALAAGNTADAERAYRNMAKVGPRGASIASMGVADVLMYQGSTEDARSELERGAAADEIGNQRAPRAMKLVALAELALASGAKAQAGTLVEQALALARSDGVIVPAARVLIATDVTTWPSP